MASIVVPFEGPQPRAISFFLWTLLLVWIEFHNSDRSMASTCAPNECDRGWGFPSHLTKLSPLMRCDKIFDNPGVPYLVEGHWV